MRDEFLWVEKYRPRTIEDCVLTKSLKDTFTDFVRNKEIPNLLLHGRAGIGKTTVARALCEEIGCDYKLINGSESGRLIDTLRTDIIQYASSVSLSGIGRKIVILDEADYLNPTSVQPALRGILEEFSQNCGFIFTCNYSNKIIPALHSRCSVINFTINPEENQLISSSFMDRIIEILKLENVNFIPQVVAELIKKYSPDWRRILNEIQRYSSSGDVDVGILSVINDENFEKLMNVLASKNFTDIRQWVVNNLTSDPESIYRRLYDNLVERITPDSVPDAVLAIGEYSYRAGFVADQEINLVCCLITIISECEFV